MKTEFVDVNETRKNVRVEIPSDVVDAEIERVARGYSRTARVPGFRPGKTPPRVIKQRFKDQILHDVAHDLIPRAVGDVLRERGVEPVDTPDVRDVTIEAGQPLTFTASFDTVPAFEPGEYSTLALRRTVEPDRRRSSRRRARAAARPRGALRAGRRPGHRARRHRAGRSRTSRRRTDCDTRRGARSPRHPQGCQRRARFDREPAGIRRRARSASSRARSRPSRSTSLTDYAAAELAGADVTYTVTVHGIKKRVLPALDDEFAKDLGEFESLEALRARVREDLEHEARHAAEREIRADLMKQLAARVPFEVPASLVEREIDRRIEDFARRLMEQQVDPRQAGIDWNAFRDSQREVAREAVAGALVLDEVARREGLEVSDEEAEREVGRFAERTGRAPAAVRARLEKEGGLSRVYSGLRREKSIDFLMARATISGES